MSSEMSVGIPSDRSWRGEADGDIAWSARLRLRLLLGDGAGGMGMGLDRGHWVCGPAGSARTRGCWIRKDAVVGWGRRGCGSPSAQRGVKGKVKWGAGP